MAWYSRPSRPRGHPVLHGFLEGIIHTLEGGRYLSTYITSYLMSVGSIGSLKYISGILSRTHVWCQQLGLDSPFTNFQHTRDFCKHLCVFVT